MNIYIDENFPHKLAQGLNILQQLINNKYKEPISILSNKLIFGEGALDEDWIPLVGEEQGCAFTQDISIYHTRHQKALCDQYKLGMFFFRPPSKTGFHNWDLVKLIIKHWEEIIKLACNTKRPFAYRISSRGEIKEL
jgi:hypothetical protein